jgi:RNA polymerase sigma-70 factor (ECF subfamily)
MLFRYRNVRPEVQIGDEGPEAWPCAAQRIDPTEQLIDRFAIEKAMQMLAPGYRAAFNLHDIQGYRHPEAARLMGHSEGTSKSQVHRARSNLRAMLSSTSRLHATLNRHKKQEHLIDCFSFA